MELPSRYPLKRTDSKSSASKKVSRCQPDSLLLAVSSDGFNNLSRASRLDARGGKLFERVSTYGELDCRAEYLGDKHSPESRVRYYRAD